MRCKFIEIKSEIGAGTRGASLGVEAIKIAAAEDNNSIFKEFPIAEITVFNNILPNISETPCAKNLAFITRICSMLATEVKNVIKMDNTFPIILGGDHSIAAGTIAGLKMAKSKERIGVVWIDAHADIHSPFTSPSGNVHGMPVAVSLAIDNRDIGKKQPNESTISLWNEIKKLGGISPKISTNDLVYVGVRDIEMEEEYFLNNNNINNFTVKNIQKNDTGMVAESVLQKLSECDYIHVSFDVDVLDPSISSGTGTPVENGLTLEQSKDLLCCFMKHPKVKSLDIVEVNPLLDNNNKMAKTAMYLLQEVMDVLKNRDE